LIDGWKRIYIIFMEKIDLVLVDAIRSVVEAATIEEGNIITHELTKTVEPSKGFWGNNKKNGRSLLRTKLIIEITQQI